MSSRTPEQEHWIKEVKARLESDPEFREKYKEDQMQALRGLGVKEADLELVAAGGGNIKDS